MAINAENDNLFAGLQEEIKEVEEEAPAKKKPGRPKKSAGVKVKKVATMDEVKEDIQEMLDGGPKRKTKSKTKKVEELDADAEKEAQKKQSLLLVLHHYAENQRFSEYLKRVAPKELYSKNLSKKTVEELEEIVVRVRFCVNNKNGGPISDGTIKGLFTMAENAATKVSRGKVLLQGTTEQLWHDEEFLDLLEQLKLEYLNFAKLDPKLQISIIIARTALMVNGVNQHNRQQRLQQAQQDGIGHPASVPDQQAPNSSPAPIVPNLPLIPPVIAPPQPSVSELLAQIPKLPPLPDA